MDIRAARIAKGISPSQLARLVGTTPTTVWRWETGKKKPSAVNLVPLAKALGITVEQLQAEGETAVDASGGVA